MYRVLREVFVPAGELVTLETVDKRNRQALIEAGIVEVVEQKPARRRAKSEEVSEDGD